MPRGVIRGYGEIKRFLPAMGRMFLLALAFFLFAGVAGAQMTQNECDNYSLPTSPTDRDILIKFYCDTGGPDWKTNTNWGSDMDLDTWHGVTVRSGRVQVLSLRTNKLSGSIPPELGNLSALVELRLSSNQLSGSIPPELGSLTNLNWLELSENQLSGNIPPELGDLGGLSILYLDNNQLSGSIPPELGSLTDLNWLRLQYNPFLEGDMPLSLRNLSRLRFGIFNVRCTGVTEPTDSAFQAWLDTISSIYIPPPHSSCDYEFKFRLGSRDILTRTDLSTDDEENLVFHYGLTIAEGETLTYYVRLKPLLTKKDLQEDLGVNITGHDGTELIFNRPTHFTLEPGHVNEESWKVLSITANPDDDTGDDKVKLVHEACCLGERDNKIYAKATLTVTIDEDKRVSTPPAPSPPSGPPPAPSPPSDPPSTPVPTDPGDGQPEDNTPDPGEEPETPGDGEEPEDSTPTSEVEESEGGCAVASAGGVEGSTYSLAFAVFALAAIWGAKIACRREFGQGGIISR